MSYSEIRKDHPTFEIKNLNLWYLSKSQKALNGINLKIFGSKINVILGQNGSGKSSLLKCLAGTQNWNEGEVFRSNVSRGIDVRDFNRDQIFISEDILLPQFSLDELAEIYSDIWPRFDLATFQRIVAVGEISRTKKPSQLSRGQKILAQFALGLATGSKIILIDEVTATLDPYVRSRVAEELLGYQKKHSATIILATNIATEFQAEVRLILLKDGQVYLEGSSSELSKEFVKFKTSQGEIESNKNWVPLHKDSNGEQWAISRKKDFNIVNKAEAIGASISVEEIFVYISFRGIK